MCIIKVMYLYQQVCTHVLYHHVCLYVFIVLSLSFPCNKCVFPETLNTKQVPLQGLSVQSDVDLSSRLSSSLETDRRVFNLLHCAD